MTTNQSSETGDLPDLQVHAIDRIGRKGLGHTDLTDPKFRVLLFAELPDQAFPGDYVELLWNDEVLQSFYLPDVERATIDFALRPDDIPDQPSPAQVFYRITNRDWGFELVSAIREVEVKRSVPGAPDPDPRTPVLNEGLAPIVGLPEQIGPSTPLLTLYIEPWEGMQAGDVLTLYWGGHDLPVSNPPLTEQQVGQPQTVTVDLDVLLEGGDNQCLPVSYDIRDRVDNWSLYSPTVCTDIKLHLDAPPAPKVEEADERSVLDLDTLGDRNITVRITTYDGIQTGDLITLYMSSDTDGLGADRPLEVKTVTDPAFAPVFTLTNATVAASLNGSIELYYQVQSSNGAARVSSSITVQVTGALPTLEAPIADNAQAGILDPAQIPGEGVTVRIKPYRGKGFGDVIYLYWTGTDTEGAPVFYSDEYSVGEGEEQLDTVFPPIEPVNLQALAGSTLTLLYSVEQFDGFWTHSDIALYTVVSSARLPAPGVDYLLQEMLDPDLNIAGTSVRIDGAGAALRRGDIVTIAWRGEPGSGSHSATLKVSSDNQNLRLYIDKTRVEANRNQDVEVSYKVKRAVGGYEQLSQVLTVHVKSSQTLVLPPASLPQATDNILDPLNALEGATVQVSYAGMSGTDQITLSWNNNETLATPASQPGNSSGSVSFQIAARDIGAVINRIINVQYRVIRAGKVLTSDPLALKIGDLPTTASDRLLAPAITQATAEQDLKVYELNSDAEVSVQPWPFIAVGQPVWLHLEGTLKDGTPYHWLHPQWQNWPIISSDPQRTSVPLDELRKLKEGSTLRLIVEVSFDGGQTRVALPITVLNIRAIAPAPPPPAIDVSDMVLDGRTIQAPSNWRRTDTDTPGNTASRPGQGGTPPYTYSSSNNRVALVDANGKVTGNANGQATITIRDSANHSSSYTVKVSNVFTLVIYESAGNFDNAARLRSNANGLPLTQDDLKLLASRYQKPFPLTLGKGYWLGVLDSGWPIVLTSNPTSYAYAAVSKTQAEVTGALALLRT